MGKNSEQFRSIGIEVFHSIGKGKLRLYLGLDFGTSGARAIAIDLSGEIRAESRCPYPDPASENVARDWQAVLENLLDSIPASMRQQVGAISIDGTSSTTLLCDRQGHPLHPPLMYDDNRAGDWALFLTRYAPAHHVALSPSSGLAKLCWLLSEVKDAASHHCLSQADWLGYLLHGRLGVSDYHNCLKLGYDVVNLCWPDWVQSLQVEGVDIVPYLPEVLPPGTPVDTIRREIADRYGFPPSCLVTAGTTDSIAAFMASGVQQIGEAVTSLGSTLAVKLLSNVRVEDSRYGIYSHWLGDRWLVGGASNTGGAVLRQFFSDDQLRELSDRINPDFPSPLDYYPLLKPGERFPINDSTLAPHLTPRPTDDAEFLQGLLESMAKIEARGYRLLNSLGAPRLNRVVTAGGGAANATWSAIRERILKVPVEKSLQTEAAYGSALMARGRANQ